jgi:16S rRNA U516 pseudouridylate synthase RsuA-like enzyme
MCSRREAEELIARGQVAVDGEVLTQGAKVDPGPQTLNPKT